MVGGTGAANRTARERLLYRRGGGVGRFQVSKEARALIALPGKTFVIVKKTM